MSEQRTSPEEVRLQLLSYLSDDVVCGVLEGEDSRIGCVTPLAHSDGDAVVVWVREAGGAIEVSDYGESIEGALTRSKKDRKELDATARGIAFDLGVDFFEDRLSAQAQPDAVGEYIWRVAAASARLTQVIDWSRPKRGKEPEENEFVRVVTDTLKERQVEVQRDHKLVGRSGHPYRATLYVPKTEAVLEPVASQHWHAVNAIYTRFGDLRQANGYGLYSLIDDRQQEPSEDIGNLLVQVSNVIRWTEQERWIESFLR